MAFDPDVATAAYIDALGPDALARAAAYTAGNHWLLLWGLCVSAAATWIVVRSGILDRFARRLSTRGPGPRSLLLGLLFFLVLSALTLPWDVWAEWARERAYGRTSQSLGDFLAQAALAAAVYSTLGAAFFTGLYAVMRRAGGRWWLWAGGFTAASLAGFLLAAPVLIQPMFNDYRPLPEGEVRDAVVAQARQAGVPAERVFVFDGSRQSNNFTANAAGIGGTARVAISDVAYRGASLDEVRAVVGHEIGHYVLSHVWRNVLVYSTLSVALFWLVDRLYLRFARAFGSDARLPDPVGLPVLVFMLALFALLARPVTNTLSRVAETEADRYSLETVGQPDALATALVKTAEYRDPRPHRLQELLFYTHPSVERRVRMAMEWKAARESNLAPER